MLFCTYARETARVKLLLPILWFTCFVISPGNQWLQFDFGPPRKVTGILTLGRGDGRRKRFVTQYSLSYSNNSVVWHFYKDDNHLDPKVSQITVFNYLIRSQMAMSCLIKTLVKLLVIAGNEPHRHFAMHGWLPSNDQMRMQKLRRISAIHYIANECVCKYQMSPRPSVSIISNPVVRH